MHNFIYLTNAASGKPIAVNMLHIDEFAPYFDPKRPDVGGTKLWSVKPGHPGYHVKEEFALVLYKVLHGEPRPPEREEDIAEVSTRHNTTKKISGLDLTNQEPGGVNYVNW